MNVAKETLKLVEAFHAEFGNDKRIHINKDGKMEIVPATSEEMLEYEKQKSNFKSQGRMQ